MLRLPADLTFEAIFTEPATKVSAGGQVVLGTGVQAGFARNV
jgi:hypothetical protein